MTVMAASIDSEATGNMAASPWITGSRSVAWRSMAAERSTPMGVQPSSPMRLA